MSHFYALWKRQKWDIYVKGLIQNLFTSIFSPASKVVKSHQLFSRQSSIKDFHNFLWYIAKCCEKIVNQNFFSVDYRG